MDLLKERHFVIHLRSLARKTVALSVGCRRETAKATQEAIGLLLTFRTTECNPFTHVGIDSFGPMLNKRGAKRCGLLLVCAVTRGVYAEVGEQVSTEAVWTCLRRAFARRGRPETIYSDNGTAFVRAAKDIKKLFEHLKSTEDEEAEISPIKWEFSAPWQRGFFERLIGTFKKVLMNVCETHKMTDAELTTVFAETEALVNSRPLMIAEDGLLVTPECFTIGRRPISFPAVGNKRLKELPATLRAFTTKQRTVNAFWRTWKKSYLVNLRDRYQQTAYKRPLKTGENVFVMDDQVKRNDWPIGKIVEAIAGQDQN
jgi:transposase InsO family protein